MKYNYRHISPERCQEINNMKIPSPLPPYYPEFFVMESEGKKYFSSEDENLIFTAAFIPIPADREFYRESEHQDTCHQVQRSRRANSVLHGIS